MNYKKLFDDLKTGKFDPERVVLIMDNDGGYWRGKASTDSENEQIELKMEQRYGRPRGYADLVDIIKATGIDCDWC